MTEVRRRSRRQVALKIVQADFSKDNRELDVFQYLTKSKLPHPGKEQVIGLLDNFEHEGPNGTHLCLVLPVMLSDCNEITVRGLQRNAAYIKELSRQITLGVDFLHASGLIHTGKDTAFLTCNGHLWSYSSFLTSTRLAAGKRFALSSCLIQV